MDFINELDSVDVLYSEAVEGKGEDSHFAGYCSDCALIGAFDGSGGLGSRQYDSFQHNTGAYMASHVLSPALKNWFDQKEYRNCSSGTQLADSINQYFRKNLNLCDQYASGYLKLRGSMVRDFPSTAAIAFVRNENNQLRLHVIWAGDSRVYCLNKRGLKQLTEDDADGDAFESLLNGAPMTNVISSDGKYVLHSKSMSINEPMMIIAVSDGAYGYVHTPMDFEYLIVRAICESADPDQMRANLFEELHTRAGDDMTFAYISIGYGSYQSLQKSFADRLKRLRKEYMDFLENRRNDLQKAAELWQKYKPGYEEYLSIGGNNG